jgi:hypothetical protein
MTRTPPVHLSADRCPPPLGDDLEVPPPGPRNATPYRFRRTHPHTVIFVDQGLPPAWLDRLNALPGVEVRSTCAGHPENERCPLGHVNVGIEAELVARVPELRVPPGLSVTVKDGKVSHPDDVRWWVLIKQEPDAPAWWLLEAVRWLEALVWSPRWGEASTPDEVQRRQREARSERRRAVKAWRANLDAEWRADQARREARERWDEGLRAAVQVLPGVAS